MNSNQDNTISKKTPLHDLHVQLGAKMVDFAGWRMPIQYKGLKEEHFQVRKVGGLFDVSHMGEIRFRGPKSLESLEWLTSNSVSKLKAGEAQYSLLTNPAGGIVDDIIIYCLDPGQDYLVCVNAANEAKDWNWMQQNNRGADLSNESLTWGQIAVQGPRAFELLSLLTKEDWSQRKAFTCFWWKFSGQSCLVAMTGYTGERGVEIFAPSSVAAALFGELLEIRGRKGVEDGSSDLAASNQFLPIGLGARDTLRTEMKYSLYGHEITDETNPLEAGLGWVVKANEKNFIGKDKILEVKAKGLGRKLVGFRMLDKSIVRDTYSLVSALLPESPEARWLKRGPPTEETTNETGKGFVAMSESVFKKIGVCTSGTFSPSLGYSIGIGYVPLEFSPVGSRLGVEIRGKVYPAEVVETPFVRTTSLSTHSGQKPI